jgi:hypothetical protein
MPHCVRRREQAELRKHTSNGSIYGNEFYFVKCNMNDLVRLGILNPEYISFASKNIPIVICAAASIPFEVSVDQTMPIETPGPVWARESSASTFT